MAGATPSSGSPAGADAGEGKAGEPGPAAKSPAAPEGDEAAAPQATGESPAAVPDGSLERLAGGPRGDPLGAGRATFSSDSIKKIVQLDSALASHRNGEQELTPIYADPSNATN